MGIVAEESNGKPCRQTNGLAAGFAHYALSDIVHARRSITAEMASLLARALGTTPGFWLDLEIAYQLKSVDQDKLAKVEHLILSA